MEPAAMYARAIDDAETRLLELHHEERYQLGLSILVLAASLAMTAIYVPVVLPLFVGGLAVGMLGMRTFWQRWDIVDRLADERDAYVIPEVLSYAARDARMERRSTWAALIRSWLCTAALAGSSPLLANAEELAALACELEDRELELDPTCAVACRRFLTDGTVSPLFDDASQREDIESWIVRIRDGFTPRTPPSAGDRGSRRGP
jgi:hypothetical protein